MMLPSVWSSLFSVNKQAFGTLVSLFILIFFSPSNKRNDSKAGGAFILNIEVQLQPLLLTVAAQSGVPAQAAVGMRNLAAILDG